MTSRMLKISPAPRAVTRKVRDGRERRDMNRLDSRPASLAQLSGWNVILLRHRLQAAACGSYLQSITMARAHRAEILPSEKSRLMTPATLIEQELAAAEAARQNASLPLPIRQAAERLGSAVAR